MDESGGGGDGGGGLDRPSGDEIALQVQFLNEHGDDWGMYEDIGDLLEDPAAPVETDADDAGSA